MAILRRFIAAIRTRGVRRTLESVVDVAEGLWFEHRLRVDTADTIHISELSIDSPSRASGRGYEAVRVGHLRRVLARIPVEAGACFVDFGAGKGRALFIAHLAGYSRVVGVEFAKDLCRAAEENIVRFRTKTGATSKLEVVHANAEMYQIEPDQTVFFFNNPFHSSIMAAVVANIEASLRAYPREAWLLYTNPDHADIVERSPMFKEAFREDWGSGFTIAYRHLAPSAPG
jgi:SAM-dependent methyltransferase